MKNAESLESNLSVCELKSGIESYIGYLCGATIFNNPHSDISARLLGHEKLSEETELRFSSLFSLKIENIILSSLKRVIRIANGNSIGNAKNDGSNYYDNLPKLSQIHESAFGDIEPRSRIQEINPVLLVARPFPLLDQKYYNLVSKKSENSGLSEGEIEGLICPLVLSDDFEDRQTRSLAESTKKWLQQNG